MERGKIKSPKTQRAIYIDGDAYKKLITKEGYTAEYLLSLPKINDKQTNIPILNDDVILQIALQTRYFDLLHLCETQQRYYHRLCQNEHFWQLKYNHDFKDYNHQRYERDMDYAKKWFPKTVISFEEYNQQKLKEASNSWKELYENEFYNKINDIAHQIFYRFGISEKYDYHYHKRKRKITLAIIVFLQHRSMAKNENEMKQLNTKVVNDLKKILGVNVNDFNYYDTFFKRQLPDQDTVDQFLLKMALKEL